MAGDLIDTAVFVDALRGGEKARDFLDAVSQAGTALCPDVVLAELLTACRGGDEMRKVVSFVRDFMSLLYHDTEDSRVAIDLRVRYRPAHGVGYHDCLLAAMALRQHAVLHSPNVKHLAVIEGLHVRRPY